MTTTDTVPAESLARRWSAGRFLGAFLVGVGLTSVLVAAGLVAFDRAYEGRVLPGVRVGGVDLSGLDAAAASERLGSAFGALGEGRVVLGGAAGETELTYAELERRPDVAAMVSDALATGRPAGPLERVLAEVRTAFRGVDLAPRVSLDSSVVEARLAAIADRLDAPAEDAAAIATEDGFTVRPATIGRQTDRASALAAIVEPLSRVDAPSRIDVPVRLEAVRPSVEDPAARIAALRAGWMAHDLVLRDGDDEWTIPAETVRTWIAFAATPDGRYEPAVDGEAVAASLEAIAPKVVREPVSATFLTGKGKLVVGVEPAIDGRALDSTGSVERIVAELGRRAATPGAATPAIAPALLITKPELSTEEAEEVTPLMERISTWTTWYPIGEKNGFGANIEIPTKYIDGTVVAPGGVFDFWKVVGEVTPEKGYRQGGAIINGRTEPQGALAGGICSCSTTIFNAALRAGLQMGSRRNHYYYIDRYPLGLDATVFISASGAVQTMSWTNDTPYPILVRGTISRKGSKGYVTFDLYSVPTGRTVTFTKPIVKDVKPATTVTEETTTLPPGERKQIEWPADGKKVWVTRTVRDASGAVIHEETYYSNYARVDGIILVGVAPPPPATPEPSAEPSTSP